MNNTFKFEVHKEIKDEKGNYIILDMAIQEYRMTLVAVYGPNDDSPIFFSNIQTLIESLSNSSITMVGD